MIRFCTLAAGAGLAALTGINAWAADPLPTETHKVLTVEVALEAAQAAIAACKAQGYNITVTVTYPDTYPTNPDRHCADRNCRVAVDASSPFVPLPSQYLLGGAFQITLRGGSQLVIQR